MPTDETGERRRSQQRRVVMQQLLASIEQANGMTPRELVVVLRGIQLTQARMVIDDRVRDIVSSALDKAANHIEKKLGR